MSAGEACVPQLYVRVLGPLKVAVDDVPCPLSPLATRLLALLVAADGAPVPISRLHRELWPDSLDRGHRNRQSRVDVQRRVVELRKGLFRDEEPAACGLRTEQVYGEKGNETAYRLVLSRRQLDSAQFIELAGEGLYASAPIAVAALARAVELWRGSPLAEAGSAQFGRPLIQRLTALHEAALAELLRLRIDLGQFDAALPLAVEAAVRRPEDPAAVERLRAVRSRLRELRRDALVERDFPALRTKLVISRGDLFDQKDVNIVVGFTDTFDTSTEDNLLISRDSVQGQLLHRCYGDDGKALDRELQRGLRAVTPVGRESVRDKPKGKRLRYRLGTVVPLPHEGRWIFAVAYSRQENDLTATSGPEQLRQCLEQTWSSVAVHGKLKPVAIALVGSGLARVTELSREQLLTTIVDTFLAARWKQSAVSPELRVVIRPEDLPSIRMAEVVAYVENLHRRGDHGHG
jgi:DNA-binding SARP family transcriptional activator